MTARAMPVPAVLLLAAAPLAGVQWLEGGEVGRTIDEWRVEWGVPGAAVGVVRDGEVLLLEGFGVRRIGGNEPVDARTLFEFGSASKTFTATLAALAVESGLLEWETPLIDLLSGLRLGDPWIEREITLLDALTHGTGYARADLLWLGGATPEEILRRIRHVPASGRFRRDFAYSNLMYILAGEALGRAFGGGWERALADRITGPLGMHHTLAREVQGLGRKPGDHDGSAGDRAGEAGDPAGEAGAPENAARPHVRLGDSLIVATTPATHVGPAGGIRSSVEDLAAWMRFHLDAGGEVAAMREPRTPLPVEAFGAQYARASRLSYGAGWFVSDYAGRPMVDHIGGHGGMVANVTLLPEEGIGVAVLTNHGDNLLPVAVTYHILDILLGLDPRPWNRTMIDFWEGVRAMRDAGAEAPGGARVEGAPSRLPAADYGGRYASPAYGDLDVEWDGEGLRLRYGAGLHGRLSHWHHDTFRVTWADPGVRAILGRGFVSFHLDMGGRPSGVTMTGFQGERVEAARVDDDPGGGPRG